MAALFTAPGMRWPIPRCASTRPDRYAPTPSAFRRLHLLAATAALNSLPVATFDSDYKNVPDVVVDLGENEKRRPELIRFVSLDVDRASV